MRYNIDNEEIIKFIEYNKKLSCKELSFMMGRPIRTLRSRLQLLVKEKRLLARKSLKDTRVTCYIINTQNLLKEQVKVRFTSL